MRIDLVDLKGASWTAELRGDAWPRNVVLGDRVFAFVRGVYLELEDADAAAAVGTIRSMEAPLDGPPEEGEHGGDLG